MRSGVEVARAVDSSSSAAASGCEFFDTKRWRLQLLAVRSDPDRAILVMVVRIEALTVLTAGDSTFIRRGDEESRVSTALALELRWPGQVKLSVALAASCDTTSNTKLLQNSDASCSARACKLNVPRTVQNVSANV